MTRCTRKRMRHTKKLVGRRIKYLIREAIIGINMVLLPILWACVLLMLVNRVGWPGFVSGLALLYWTVFLLLVKGGEIDE